MRSFTCGLSLVFLLLRTVATRLARGVAAGDSWSSGFSYVDAVRTSGCVTVAVVVICTGSAADPVAGRTAGRGVEVVLL
jgi:hypothetical protein